MIKAAGGRGANYLFGVTDMQLMRKCPCPVWTFKPSSTPKFNTILAAVDTDPTHPENSALNQLILELAISLAQSDSSELIIVNAWHLEHEKYLRSNRVLLGDEEIDAMVVNIRESHQKWMDDLVSSNDFGSIKPGIMLKKGIPEEIIPKIAKESGAELIVMGTLSRTGIAGLFIGNTAEKTLNSVDCSVLTVKPGSFVSPVKSS